MSLATVAADVVRAVGGKDPAPSTSAIIVAAGKSTRMGSKGSKNLLLVAGKPVLAHTLLSFQNTPDISEIVVVARAEDIGAVRELAAAHGITKLSAVTPGGASRAESVKLGFDRIDPKAKYVAIHDGARCLITPDEITKVTRAAYRHRAATAATPVVDTVKLATKSGFVESTADRDRVMLAQTPQVFHTDLYRAALATVKSIELLTDDNQLIERIGHPVKLVRLGKTNLKITHPEDVAWAEFIIRQREVTP